MIPRRALYKIAKKIMEPEKLGFIITLVAGLSFGTYPIFVKLAYARLVNVHTLLFLRFAGSASALWIYISFRRSKGARQDIDKIILDKDTQ